MTKNRIISAIAALSLLTVPAVAVAHGSGDHNGKHHKHHGKKAKKKTPTVTGTVASFTNGELTISLVNGKSFTADVKRRTVILCKSAPVVPATTARHGDDDGKGRNGHDDHPATSTTPASTTTPSTTAPAPTTGNADHNKGHGARCGADALVAGARVTTAKLSLQDGSATWKKVVILK